MEFGTNSSIGRWKVKREKNPLRKVSLQRDRSPISLPLFLVLMFCLFYRRINRIEKSSIQRNCNETLKASPPSVFFFFLFLLARNESETFQREEEMILTPPGERFCVIAVG